jgi:hypothetical protein
MLSAEISRAAAVDEMCSNRAKGPAPIKRRCIAALSPQSKRPIVGLSVSPRDRDADALAPTFGEAVPGQKTRRTQPLLLPIPIL